MQVAAGMAWQEPTWYNYALTASGIRIQWVTGTKNMRFSGRPQNILNPKNKATGKTPNILISPHGLNV